MEGDNQRTTEQVSTDPQPNDCAYSPVIFKCRRVIRRERYDIIYRDSVYGPEKQCFISTWMDWCRRNKITTTPPADALLAARKDVK